jgi:predicted Rossmann fold flavoprotein
VSDLEVAIVGAGAAGLATAIFTARRLPGSARRIAVFDGARRIGAKILVSGGGRCNVTNRDVRASDYWGGDRRVVDSVLRAFPAGEAAGFFRQLGVPVHEEAAGKLFPDSNQSRTVLDALTGEIARLGVRLEIGWRVDRLEARGDGGFALHGARGIQTTRVAVLATGGLSLPKSGSDGGGFALARSLGHSLVATTPALAPLVLGGGFHTALAGISHEASLTVAGEGERRVTLRGPVLWTHFGLSGPAALDASRHWHRSEVEHRPVSIRLSFVPGIDFRAVEQRLIDAASGRAASAVRTVVGEWLPSAVAAAVIAQAGIGSSARAAHLTRDDRRRLAHALTEFDLPVTGSRGYNYAEATAGGVPLTEVDRHTMGSSVRPGLFFAGEMLDVDGRLGGFNFQWAWSSAWVAARGVAHAMHNAQCTMKNEE